MAHPEERVITESELRGLDGGIARLVRDDEVAGHLAASLGRFRSLLPPWRSQPCVWIDLVWSDGLRVPPMEDYPPWTDVRDLLDGFFVPEGLGPSRDGRYAVEWLDEPERSARRTDLGLA